MVRDRRQPANATACTDEEFPLPQGTDDNGREDRDRIVAAHPTIIAATAMLRMCMGTGLKTHDRSPQVILVIAPTEAWRDPISTAFRLAVKGGRIPVRSGMADMLTSDERDWVKVQSVNRKGGQPHHLCCSLMRSILFRPAHAWELTTATISVLWSMPCWPSWMASAIAGVWS